MSGLLQKQPLMKVYLVEFVGHWLPGQMLVVDETRRKAFNAAKREIDLQGLADKNKDFSVADVTEVNCDIRRVVLVNDGDY